MHTKIADVAKRAGVSTASVSRVLAGKPYVSAPMRARVLAAVDELDYRPSRVARSLRAQRANIIGLIVSDIQNPFFTAIVRGVEDIAYERQCGVFLCNSDEDPEKEALYIDLMLAEQVSGVIISPTVEGAPHYGRLLAAGIPLVAVDRELIGLKVDTVRVDNIATTIELMERLIAAGHRRIGAIIGSALATTGAERRQGYELALRRHDLIVDERLVQIGPPKQIFGYQAASTLLDGSEPPTAFFMGNNLLTMGALQALYERHLAPGADVGLAAFDEMEWMSVIDLPVQFAAQPTYAMGYRAAQLLFARADAPTRPIETLILAADVHSGQRNPAYVAPVPTLALPSSAHAPS